MSKSARRRAKKHYAAQIDVWVAPETHAGTESRTFRDGQQRDTKAHAKRSVFTGAGKRNVPVRHDGTPRAERERDMLVGARSAKPRAGTPDARCNPAALTQAPKYRMMRHNTPRAHGYCDTGRFIEVTQVTFKNPLGVKP